MADDQLNALSKKIQQGFMTKLEGQPTQDHSLQGATITQTANLVASFRGTMNNQTEKVAPNSPTAPAQPADAAQEAVAEAAKLEQPTVAMPVSPVLAQAPNTFTQLTALAVAISWGIVSMEVKDDTISHFLFHLYKKNHLLQIHQKPNKQFADMAQYHSSQSEKNKNQKVP
jgi:hypothetical protein